MQSIYTPIPTRRSLDSTDTVPRLHSKCWTYFISLVLLDGFSFLGRNRKCPHFFLRRNREVSCFVLHCVRAESIYFHSSIDLADKHVGCIEANGPCQEPERQHHEGCVTKVQQRGNELDNVQLEEKTKMRPGIKAPKESDPLHRGVPDRTRRPLSISPHTKTQRAPLKRLLSGCSVSSKSPTVLLTLLVSNRPPLSQTSFSYRGCRILTR